jgi:hypothetical protein
VPWKLLPVAHETPFRAIVGRLRCSRCGSRPDPADVSPCASWTASGGGAGGTGAV